MKDGEVVAVAPDCATAVLRRGPQGWCPGSAAAPEVRDLLALYLPLCRADPRRPLAVAHLGQSLDGFIATHSGDSCFVNDQQNIVHLHRMRALCDAVLVGGGTVHDDDPRLTTRHVPGPNPLRVVLDPGLKLAPDLGLFTDGAADTLVMASPQAAARPGADCGQAEVVAIAHDAAGRPDLNEVLGYLAERGCRTVFVEGGGITVSRFLAAGLLQRLQVTVAPVFIGDGRSGVRLPAPERMGDCLRPAHRVFRMGGDVLFDFDLEGAQGSPAAPVLMEI